MGVKIISPTLRELFNRDGIIRAMGAHNALGAKMAERAGFDAIWLSSFELSASYCVPDSSIVTMSEVLLAAHPMREAVSIPIIVDGDTGYGDALNVAYMVRKFEAAGIDAVCIEDKEFPKCNSFGKGPQNLIEIPKFVEKISEAKRAKTSEDFIIIARVESLVAGKDKIETLRRANAYVEAGADAILIHSKENTLDQVAEVLSSWHYPVPTLLVPTSYNQATLGDLEKLRAKMVIYANHGLRSALQAMEKNFTEILRTGSTASIESYIMPIDTIFSLQNDTNPMSSSSVTNKKTEM